MFAKYMAIFPGKERRDVVLSVQTEDPEVKTPRGPESERKSQYYNTKEGVLNDTHSPGPAPLIHF